MMQLTTRCRYAGYDERGNPLPPDEDLGFQQSWCQTGSTCNLPWQDERDQLGLYELKERLRLDGILLQEWNKWLRSPYCQCIYPSGQRPDDDLCVHCARPMNSQAADTLDRVFGEQRRLEGERMRRLRAGPMWVMAHENTVRTAELALKLLIKAVAPAPAGQRPEFGKHDLSALWYLVPRCTRDEIRMALDAGHLDDGGPRVIDAEGQSVTSPVPKSDRPVFTKFAAEFDSIRYAWDQLDKKGVAVVEASAKEWPDSILLYYLHQDTFTVMSVLEGRKVNPGPVNKSFRTEVRLNLGLDYQTYHSDWPPSYIAPRRPE